MSVYKVVINDQQQYSIWPTARAVPAGWREAGKTGTKEECLVQVVWTDLRPARLLPKI